jgi:hypothetical protein
MEKEYDETKLSTRRYGLCDKCKHIDDYIGKCWGCDSVAGVGASMLLCGIPVGTSVYYYHANYEPLDNKI